MENVTSNQVTTSAAVAGSTPNPSVTPGQSVANAGQPASPPPPPQTPPAGNQPVAPKKSRSMLWVIILLVVAFICGLFVVGWYFQSQLQKVAPTQEVVPTPVVKLEKLIVGTDATFQPMEYVASEGAIIGYDIDLGNNIAAELDTTIEFKNIPWDDIFKALEDKQIDMIISSVSITDARKQIYDFSEEYLNAGQVILTRKDNTTITTAESLTGKKIAVQEGTTNETEALKYTPEELVVRFPDFEQATKALIDGKVDAMLSDLPGAKGITTTNPTLKIASDPFTNEYYGIVFRRGDPKIEKINEAIAALRTKGILTDLKQKWLD